MKINILSNAPWAMTGYGVQTRHLAPALKASGHEVSITAYYGLEGGRLNWNGIPVLPRMFQPYGQDIIGAHAARDDIMLTNMDAWVCDPDAWPMLKWVAWFPIDHDPIPGAVLEKVRRAFHRVTVSRFGLRKMEERGLDCDYAPYSIDAQIYAPGNRAEARKVAGLPADAFIVGMVAMNKGNPSRKAFAQQLAAFSLFRERRRDAVLYLHTAKCEHGENGGVNLVELCNDLGLKIGKDVIFPDRYQQAMGYPDDWMAMLYNAFDVLLSVSCGEGFGVPIVEAQACGTPVIVGDWTSMSELCFSGWRVGLAEAQPVWTAMSAYQFSPNVEPIAARLELAYRKKDNQVYRDKARAGALAYDTPAVFENHWNPILAKIAAKLEIPQIEQFGIDKVLDGLR